MSTQDEVVKKTTTLTLTRGAVYLIEGLLQTPTPFKTTVLTHRAAKLWGKLRKLNKCEATVDGEMTNLEKAYAKGGRSDEEFARYRLARDDAYQTWSDQEITIELTKKEIDTVTTGIEWAIKNREKIWPQNNNHVAAILDVFDVTDEEE